MEKMYQVIEGADYVTRETTRPQTETTFSQYVYGTSLRLSVGMFAMSNSAMILANPYIDTSTMALFALSGACVVYMVAMGLLAREWGEHVGFAAVDIVTTEPQYVEIERGEARVVSGVTITAQPISLSHNGESITLEPAQVLAIQDRLSQGLRELIRDMPNGRLNTNAYRNREYHRVLEGNLWLKKQPNGRWTFTDVAYDKLGVER